MNTIEIVKSNAETAYKNADAKGKKLLEDLLGKTTLLPEKITDRIKTFEDVLEALGITQSSNYYIFLNYRGSDPDLISSQSHLKLTLIARALNEGWVADWSDSSQYKYAPYFIHKSGFGLSYGGFDGWLACTVVGSRLCYKTAELAKYAATQFADIYNDFLTIK